MKNNSCMINEENFERLTTSLDKNAKEHLSYERLVSLWNDYCDVASLSPDEISAEKSDFVTIAHYYSIAWGLCCLSISSNSSNEKADSLAYTIQSMTAAIANNNYAITSQRTALSSVDSREKPIRTLLFAPQHLN